MNQWFREVVVLWGAMTTRIVCPESAFAHIGAFGPGGDLLNELLNVRTVEVPCVDGRRRNVNGLLLADFFDFT